MSVIVVMTAQQECLQSPLVETDCTISPCISWLTLVNMPGSTSWLMMGRFAPLGGMKAAIVEQTTRKLHAVLWWMLKKVKGYSYFGKLKEGLKESQLYIVQNKFDLKLLHCLPTTPTNKAY